MMSGMFARFSPSAFEWLVVLALLALAIFAPLAVYDVLLMQILCYTLFAAAFNFLWGNVGLISFGHAAFFGMSAYTTAYAAKVWAVPPELSLAMGVAVASLLGLAFGTLAIRRSGIYFGMITLALAQIVYFFCVEARFTGGEEGINAVPRRFLFGIVDLGKPLNMYYFVLATVVAGACLLYRAKYSPFGEVLNAIRENETRTISLGYDPNKYKLLAFVLSAAVSGLAGGLSALISQLATLSDVDWTTSGEAVLMVLLGGVGTTFGPLVGAVVIVSMQNYLAELQSRLTIVEGIIFVVCVIAFRRGIVGEIARVSRGLWSAARGNRGSV